MKKDVRNFLKRIDRHNLTTNTQYVLYTLLTALQDSDGWVDNFSFDFYPVLNVGSRVRDLRTNRYGHFDVKCRSAGSLGKPGDNYTYYYKLGQRNLTVAQLRRVFGNVS